MKNITINGERLWDSLMQMAKIGATAKGGGCRLALTDLDKQGRDLFVAWCEDAGCTVSVDKMGNIFARRPGQDNQLPPVVMGSHLDTQPTGGRFDGVLSGSKLAIAKFKLKLAYYWKKNKVPRTLITVFTVLKS